jgi:hypothetical protein
MCGSPKSPTPAPKLPEAPVAPMTDASASGASNRRRRAATNSGTLLTGSGGVMNNAPIGQKTLLGT